MELLKEFKDLERGSRRGDSTGIERRGNVGRGAHRRRPTRRVTTAAENEESVIGLQASNRVSLKKKSVNATAFIARFCLSFPKALYHPPSTHDSFSICLSVCIHSSLLRCNATILNSDTHFQIKRIPVLGNPFYALPSLP
jgi:hypothetical protein